MNRTERLLQAILDELRGLRADLRRRSGEPEPSADETVGPFLSDSGLLYRVRHAPVEEEGAG